MVVYSTAIELSELDLGHLAYFLGLRVNSLVVARLRRSGFKNVRESHGFLIQHLIDADRTITELAQRMGVSQQMASKAVDELVRLGAVERSPGADRRTKRIGLSKKGWQSIKTARQARIHIHDRLRASIGERDYQQAMRTLIAALKELGG